MGFNTVAFMLNDMMHDLERSPHAATFALTHPPMSSNPRDVESWRAQISSVAAEHNEPRIHSQALEVLPTFHADWSKFIFAGGNTIKELLVKKIFKSKTDGKMYVTLQLPDWFNPKDIRMINLTPPKT